MVCDAELLNRVLAYHISENDLSRLDTETLVGLIIALRNESVFDVTTRVHNRRRFNVVLGEMLARLAQFKERPTHHRGRVEESSVGLIFADIDHFKRINDTYGHPCGDHVLSCVAQCLRDAVRPDDFLARIGGEEFAVIVSRANLEICTALAERLRNAVQNLIVEYGDEFISVTMSFGAVTTQDVGCDLEKLLKAADTALYEAKNSGRNQVCSCTSTLRGGS